MAILDRWIPLDIFHRREAADALGEQVDRLLHPACAQPTVYSELLQRSQLIENADVKNHDRILTSWVCHFMPSSLLRLTCMLAQRAIDKDVNRTDRGHQKFESPDSPALADLRAILYAQAAIDVELGPDCFISLAS